MEQLVTRSVTGKAIYMVAIPLLRLLRADKAAKLKLVNTGTRVLERTDAKGMSFAFRLAQEGLPCLLPYMSKQVVFASTDDVEFLLRNRVADATEFASDMLKQGVSSAVHGPVAIVHDPDGRGQLDLSQPLPLTLAAVRRSPNSCLIELLIKKADSAALLNRIELQQVADTGV